MQPSTVLVQRLKNLMKERHIPPVCPPLVDKEPVAVRHKKRRTSRLLICPPFMLQSPTLYVTYILSLGSGTKFMINLQSGNHSILPFGASNLLVCVHHSKVVSTSNFSKLLCRRSVKASRGTGHVALVNTIAVRFGSITSASFGRSSSDLNHNLPRETFKLHVSELIPIVNKPQARRLAK